MSLSALTLVERFALAEPNSIDGLMALRLLLVDWQTRGFLTLETRIQGGKTTSRILTGKPLTSEVWFTLRDGTTASAYAEGLGAKVVRALHEVGKEGVPHPLGRAAVFLREYFGGDYRDFHTHNLFPSLVAQGVLKAETHRKGFHTETVLVSTMEGKGDPSYWKECFMALSLLTHEIAQDPENLDTIAALALRAGDTLLFDHTIERHLRLISKAVRSRSPQSTAFLSALEASAQYGKQIEKTLTTRRGITDITGRR